MLHWLPSGCRQRSKRRLTRSLLAAENACFPVSLLTLHLRVFVSEVSISATPMRVVCTIRQFCIMRHHVPSSIECIWQPDLRKSSN